jgi:hypothetical protein
MIVGGAVVVVFGRRDADDAILSNGGTILRLVDGGIPSLVTAGGHGV